MNASQMISDVVREKRAALEISRRDINNSSRHRLAFRELTPRLQSAISNLRAMRQRAKVMERVLRRAGLDPDDISWRLRMIDTTYDKQRTVNARAHVKVEARAVKLTTLRRDAEIALMAAKTPAQKAAILTKFRRAIEKL